MLKSARDQEQEKDSTSLCNRCRAVFCVSCSLYWDVSQLLQPSRLQTSILASAEEANAYVFSKLHSYISSNKEASAAAALEH